MSNGSEVIEVIYHYIKDLLTDRKYYVNNSAYNRQIELKNGRAIRLYAYRVGSSPATSNTGQTIKGNCSIRNVKNARFIIDSKSIRAETWFEADDIFLSPQSGERIRSKSTKWFDLSDPRLLEFVVDSIDSLDRLGFARGVVWSDEQ